MVFWMVFMGRWSSRHVLVVIPTHCPIRGSLRGLQATNATNANAKQIENVWLFIGGSGVRGFQIFAHSGGLCVVCRQPTPTQQIGNVFLLPCERIFTFENRKFKTGGGIRYTVYRPRFSHSSDTLAKFRPNIGGNCECFTMCPGFLLLFCSWTSGEPSEFRPKIGGKNEIFKNKFPEFITIFVLGPPVKPQNFAYKIGG